MLTAEEIERGELLDYSLSENKVQDKIPSTPKSQAVKEENWKTEGKLAIEGKLSKEAKNELKFVFPLLILKELLYLALLHHYKLVIHQLIAK